MTIRDIIESVKKNTEIDDKTKIRWLSELDFKIYEDIVLRHEGAEQYMTKNGDGTFSPRSLPYESDACELIAPERFRKMYEAYLRLETDFQLDELERYSNDVIIFNEQYAAFSAWYNETHMPLQPATIRTAAQYKRRGTHASPFEQL